MKNEIIEKLRSMLLHKNETYGLIAKELLETKNYDELKIKFIQEKCHVSSTTVFRFCKEIGTTGFSELKFLLSQIREKNKEVLIRDNYALSRKANEHFTSIALSFVETRDLLTDQILNEVIELITNATMVKLYAVGSTYLVAQDFELKLDRLKVNTKAYNDVNLQYFAAKNSDKNTLAIGFTYSGKSDQVIKSLRISKEEGAKTILFTNEKNTQFMDLFDVIIYVSSTDQRHRLITTTSRLALLYLVDLIYYSFIHAQSDIMNDILVHNKLYD